MHKTITRKTFLNGAFTRTFREQNGHVLAVGKPMDVCSLGSNRISAFVIFQGFSYY
jgi:hypothetical protein